MALAMALALAWVVTAALALGFVLEESLDLGSVLVWTVLMVRASWRVMVFDLGWCWSWRLAW